MITQLRNKAQNLAVGLLMDDNTKALGLIPFHPWTRLSRFNYLINFPFEGELLHEFGVDIEDDEIQFTWKIIESQMELLSRYLDANILLLKCLQLAVIANRDRVGKLILLPPLA